MGIFGKKKVTDRTEPQKAAREFGKTKKKKNTIIVEMSSFNNPAYFSLCKRTPLRAIKVNGEELKQPDTGWVNTMLFPNPCAAEMKTISEQLSKVDSVVANTIIEYLDKDTGQLVITLFPHGGVTEDKYDEDYEKHLNHATRQDLKRQIELRRKLWEQYANQKTK